jgi:DNA-binding HxlR family transcriptional regulator
MSKRKESSTNNINRKVLNDFCGVVYAMDIIGGRWKLLVLYKLEKKKLRFGELKKRLPNITERMLTLQLRELENDKLVKRTVFAEVPPRVEYELTAAARSLAPTWKRLEAWGKAHKEGIAGK